jgi:hypothetical protein
MNSVLAFVITAQNLPLPYLYIFISLQFCLLFSLRLVNGWVLSNFTTATTQKGVGLHAGLSEHAEQHTEY